MDEYIAVYLYDIKKAIEEMEGFLRIIPCDMKFLKRIICVEVR